MAKELIHVRSVIRYYKAMLILYEKRLREDSIEK